MVLPVYILSTELEDVLSLLKHTQSSLSGTQWRRVECSSTKQGNVTHDYNLPFKKEKL